MLGPFECRHSRELSRRAGRVSNGGQKVRRMTSSLRLEPPSAELLDALVSLGFYLRLGFLPTGEELFGERVGRLVL
ncbi:hypothetical protein GCM10009532_14550 [Microbacterium aurantiacum]